jgi:hypothetical protein
MKSEFICFSSKGGRPDATSSEGQRFEGCAETYRWRGGRVVECGALLRHWAFTGLVGSNPTLSVFTKLTASAVLFCKYRGGSGASGDSKSGAMFLRSKNRESG